MLKYIYTAALAVILITGCKKSPVNVGPTNAYDATRYPSTLADLQSVLVSCYANLRDQGIYGFHFLPKALSNSMHTINSEYNGDPAWNEMANTNLSVSNQYSGEAWQALYTGVKNCNVAISAANQYTTQHPGLSAADKQTVNLILGQAYCLRGWYYMELECLFGESYMTAGGANGDKMGVPIYTALPAGLAETQLARSSVKDVWTLIESDLQKAATLLKGKAWGSTELARVTEWSAKGLLGKAYVYTQDWTNAKTTLLDVITNSEKVLMPFDTYQNAFNGSNKLNSESLFELYIDQDSKGGYGIYSGAANSSTINGLIWAPRTFGGYNGSTPFNGTETQTQALGYPNEFFHDKNVTRFGFTLGSNYTLVANPKYNASVGPTFYNQQLTIDPVYKQNALQIRTDKTADPRLFVNALQPWIDSVKFDGNTWAKVSKADVYVGDPTKYGWSVKKYAPIDYNENSINSDKWDYYILRLADVYLLYAEAAIKGGDAITGLEYINKVKRRAYSYPINSPSPVDYLTLTSPTSATDPVLGTNPLYYERWAELFNEGSWWFDVCRWRIGQSEATYYASALNVNGALQWSDAKSYTWPIPLNEINSNSKIKQNPGY
ncbi:RagB/SusD family nutrient uptake outer membrane protein [Mucilaginibacter sp.]|uniref:RagB/SusD family nutrient uptake outer membrane protein n=1 Tax=Mucilaginibacter sp. TaxID=1882438 RepID=UPI00261F0FED|nr:RagB/SusD family nutrient uptake outer membrane protein [Mucilaginibacter sp.]MDB5031699.1 outer membrane protein nutrient binding [Mucilaginibacter sp.]